MPSPRELMAQWQGEGAELLAQAFLLVSKQSGGPLTPGAFRLRIKELRGLNMLANVVPEALVQQACVALAQSAVPFALEKVNSQAIAHAMRFTLLKAKVDATSPKPPGVAGASPSPPLVGEVSPLPPAVLETPSQPTAAVFYPPVPEAGMVAVSEGPAAPAAESPRAKLPSLDIAQTRARQRKALGRFFRAIEPTPETQPTETEDVTARAWLELEEGGRLVLVVEAVRSLPPAVTHVTLGIDEAAVVLLTSNLRSGTSRVAVMPAASPYRLLATQADGVAASLPPSLECPGLETDRASLFAARTDGQAEWRKSALVTGPVRLVVPPALHGLPLPEGAWELGAGWRAFSLSLPQARSPAFATLLSALGLTVAPTTLSVAWRGAPAHRRGSAPSGERYPCFLAGETPVLELTREGPAVAFTVLLTAAQAERDLVLPASEGAAHVALEGLAPGAYVVDIASYPGGPSERLFFAVESAPPRPPSAETVLLPDALRLPPAWRLDLRWEGLSRRWLGALYADETGRIEPAAIRRLVDPWAAAEPVADLVLDAGELGHARIPHDSCLSPEQTEAELLQLLQERGDALAVAQSDVDLTLLLLQPVAGLLGYQVGEPAPFPGGAALRLHTAMRDGDRVIRGPDALLVALRDGLAAGERPLAEAAARWRAALGAAGAQRGLLTTGLLWLVLERDRRQVPRVMSLGSPLHHEALLRFIEGGLA